MGVSRAIAPGQTWAWVTSALDERGVENAVVLAGSLKRVKTSGKLVVITSPNVPEKARLLLYNNFDLVCLMDSPIASNGFPTSEDHAKVFAFSLSLFKGCVYLSPNSVVLKKHDELISSYSEPDFFLALPNDPIDISSACTHLFTFVPSITHFAALRKILSTLQRTKSSLKGRNDAFLACVSEYADNTNRKLDVLEKRYFYQIKTNQGKLLDGFENDLAIINFGDIDPRGAYAQLNSQCMGLLESHSIDIWWKIYHNDIHLKNAHPFDPKMLNPKDKTDNDPIAIIGISCRLPDANNLDELWQMLIEGREGIKQLPAHRWPKENTITTASTKCRKTYGGFLDFPIDKFDAKFFNLSPKEAEFLDPQQRLLHEITWEALEDAAIDPLSLRGSHVGVFVGSWIHDYKDIAVKTADRDFFRIYMGNSIAATAARLSFLYGTTGPSIATESGCSSAICAVDMACKSLRSGETNLAMAAGVNLFLHPFDQTTMSFVLAPDGRCKTFDANADGFGRAEGVGVLILKRMSDAIADGDKIWALIRGTAVSQEGISKSLGTPTVYCESLAMELALKDANVEAKDVSFVEAHGTGTSVGDPMEIAAITHVYSKNRSEPLFIGSVKTNLGHTEAVSGITGIIKVILQMQHDTIAPHLNFSTVNPEINLNAIPAIIPLSPVEWKRKPDGSPRLAGVSSFGISGTDGHAIIEEAPRNTGTNTIDLKTKRPCHFLKITAKTGEALDSLLNSYEQLFENLMRSKGTCADFANIAYSANVGRSTFSHRAFIVANNAEEAVKILKSGSYRRKEVLGGKEAKICFLFTGQGSQYNNMARELYLTNPVFRLAFDKCDHLLKMQHDLHIRPVMWNDAESDGILDRTLYSQVAIFMVEYCLSRVWESWGIKPDYVLGHSLGEFAAAVAAGILSLESALQLVVVRSRLINSLPQGKMLVLKINQKETGHLLKGFQQSESQDCPLDFAALNSSEQTVLAGDSATIDKFSEFCTSKQVKSVVLAATHAFHSRHMDAILEHYDQIVRKVMHKEKQSNLDQSSQFISGMEGELITEKGVLLNSDYWVRHTRDKVNFVNASKVAFEEGCNIFLEVGPSPVLSAFIMRNSTQTGNEVMCLPSLRKNRNEWSTMLETLGKLFLSDMNNIDIDWKGFDQFYKRNKVTLPFYPFQRKRIWVDFRSTPAQIHPVVGRAIRNASKSTIFESEITLKKVPYLNDHAIGNTVIFPGAALLEMCTAAGHCAIQGLFDEFSRPRRPIILKDMRIEAPLALQDGKPCRLQTVIDLKEDENDASGDIGYSIKIFNWFEDNRTSSDEDSSSSVSSNCGQWKRHGSACFMPLVTEENKPSITHVDIPTLQAKWEKISAAKDLYDKLPEVGLRFGSTFQSLACGWKHEKCKTGMDDRDLEGLLVEVKVPTDDHDSYLVHPVILDAMLQASMLWNNKDRIHKKLHVPVHIKEYVWMAEGNGDFTARFVLCTPTAPGANGLQRTSTLLLDGSGTVLATMTDIEFIETTVKLVESVIQQQSSAMPQLWEEIWKASKKGPLHGRSTPAPMSQVSDTTVSAEVMETFAKLNELDEKERRAYRHMDDLTVSFFLNALYQLGWEPQLGEEIVLREFMKRFEIVDVAWNFMRYFFNELVQDGIIKVLVNLRDRFVFKIVKLPRCKEMIEQLCTQTVVEGEANRGDYRIISEHGKNLKDFLVGKCSPLNSLFPEDPSKPNMGGFYDEIRPWVSKTGGILNNALTGYNHLFYTKDTKDSVTFRVLEVGSGTGTGTKDYLDFLENKQVKYEYNFTDISSAFFLNAEVKFEKYKNLMQFKKFNIEEDALAQGFTPNYFDLIIACEVIHATRDVRETLKNLRVLLKTSGHIQITETTKPDRRITFLVGLLEGYWRMTDLDLRPHHATLTGEKWVDLLRSTGYTLASSIGCYQDVHSYIFAFAAEEYSIENGTESVFGPLSHEENGGKYSWLVLCDGSKFSKEIQRRLWSLNRNVVTVQRNNYERLDIDMCKQNIFKEIKKLEGDKFEGILYLWALSPKNGHGQEQISLPFLHVLQGSLELHKQTARVYVMTQGAFIGLEDSECPNYAAATIWGIAKSLRNEQPEISMHCIDLSPEKTADVQINEAFYELFWREDGEELLAFRDGKRLIPRLATLKLLNQSLSLPQFSERFQLMLPATKAISDLEFGLLNNYTLKEDEIEVQVKCCALNFRDIFAVLKPIPQFDNINSIGSDFAGQVTKVGKLVTKWKVGDAVFGMNTEQQALPSHLKTKENMVIQVPDSFTFAEAATIPAVFATSLYCLVKVAKIKKGDVCLIHTASGGVGLSAIQIAHHFGAKVIATAGSRRKRAYLRSLNIEHVFHSRNIEYGDSVLEATGGRGVDIVLNSLTGPGFIEASLKACAKNARFVEMSKLNIWTNEQVHQIRKDIDYTVADLTSLKEDEWKELMSEMMECMKQDFIKPIPYTRFDAVDIRQALGFLQKAKHIGKVVCVMPEQGKKSIKGAHHFKTPKTHLFNERSTYLISGGLGGIGLEVAKFMLYSGTKYLILVSRSAPKPEVEALLKAWNDNGKRVEAWQVDVGDCRQVAEMFQKISTTNGWPKLRGIMHAAGVLSDGVLPNQTWEKFKLTYNAKLQGTLNLHTFSKHLLLEHFVLFSSVTSLFGSPGQSNHSASNAFEDAFAHYRYSVGLPVTTINFANWGEVGVATEIDLPGIRPIATSQGLCSVEAILKSNRLQTCVMNVDSFGMVAKLFPKVKGYLDDKRLLGDVRAPTLIVNTDQFWTEVDNCEGRESKIDVFKRYIKSMLKSTLKLDPDENIDDGAEFQGLGVDSLMLLEMKNYLQNLFGSRLMLTAAHLKDCNSTKTLATRLVDVLEGKIQHENENEVEESSISTSHQHDKLHLNLEQPSIVG